MAKAYSGEQVLGNRLFTLFSIGLVYSMLSKKQLDELHNNLNELKTRTSQESVYQSGDLSFSRISGDVRDAADESVANEAVDINASIANLRKQELEDIEAALQRIDVNSYGTCIDCGVEIKFGRLLAFPVARRCLDCKNRFERGI